VLYAVYRHTLASSKMRTSTVWYIVFLVVAEAVTLLSSSYSVVYVSGGLQGDGHAWFFFFYTCTIMVATPCMLFHAMRRDSDYWRGARFVEEKLPNKFRKLAGNYGMVLTMDDEATMRLHDEIMATHTVIDFAQVDIVEKIGEGGFAAVYRGTYKGAEVAVKVMQSMEVTVEEITAFACEISVAAKLQHPNIVRVHGLCVSPPDLSIVSELCGRGNLYEMLQDVGQWAFARKLDAMLQITQGLAYLHAEGHIHRDIKPQNVLVTDDYVFKIADFGLTTSGSSRKGQNIVPFASKAQAIVAPGGESKAQAAAHIHGYMSVDGTKDVGTLHYMAPELLEHSTHYTAAIDTYALGLCFWQMHSGEQSVMEESVGQFDVKDYVLAGSRPRMQQSWPQRWVQLVESMWGPAEERPILGGVIRELQGLLALESESESLPITT
jgi:tRNA A-37 threonylcarbamoyl transferase component Bud32